MSSAVAVQPPCFCHLPSAQIEVKGKGYYKCGAKINYGELTQQLKNAKNQEEKEALYEKTPLGCKLFIHEKDYDSLEPSLFSLNPKDFPKCKHHLYAKVGVSHSDKNNGCSFFTCPAQYPDTSCGYFEWCNKAMENLPVRKDSSPSAKKRKWQEVEADDDKDPKAFGGPFSSHFKSFEDLARPQEPWNKNDSEVWRKMDKLEWRKKVDPPRFTTSTKDIPFQYFINGVPRFPTQEADQHLPKDYMGPVLF